MASAAAVPAAPSASTTAGGQPTPGTGTDAATTPAAKPSAKPIPPPQLPGVYPDGDPFPSPPTTRSADSPPSGESGRPRGPDGRFLAGASPASSADEAHTPELTTPEPTPTKFKFAGEEYDSQEAAEQNHKSLRGQFKAVQGLAKQLGGIDNVVPKFHAAAESARGWKQEAERLRAENDALRSGTRPSASAEAPTDPAATTEAAADVDWELFAEVRKLANESGEPWKADQWLMQQVREAERKRYEKLLDERLAPFNQQQHEAAVAGHVETMFDALKEFTHSDGSTAFPELADPQASYEIGRMWEAMGFPAEIALSQKGLVAAIAMYRMAKHGATGSQASPASLQSPTPPPPAVPPTPNDAAAAALLGDGRQVPVSLNGDKATSPEAAQILAGLRQTNKGNRALLGFDA